MHSTNYRPALRDDFADVVAASVQEDLTSLGDLESVAVWLFSQVRAVHDHDSERAQRDYAVRHFHKFVKASTADLLHIILTSDEPDCVMEARSLLVERYLVRAAA